MHGRSKQWEVPRRVVVYYLLFCLIVLAWLLASVVIVAQASLRSYYQGAFLSYLSRAAAATTIEYLQQGQTNLQALVERFAREHSLLYCAVVSPDGRYLAHTIRARVGLAETEATGKRLQRGSLDAIRYGGRGQDAYLEYRAPLEAGGGRVVGSLRMAVREEGWWKALQVAAEHVPLTLAAPFLFVLAGAVVLGCAVSPLAAIDSQLRAAAVAPTVADMNLQLVRQGSPSALGWNRLIRQLKETNHEGSLDRRLNEALQSLRKEKLDEVLNSLSDGVAVADAEGRITFANQALAAIFARGSEPTSLIGSSLEQILALPAEHRASQEFRDPELRSRLLVHELERQRDDGTQVLRVARNPIRSAERGSQVGHVWSVRDITQQRLAERMRNQFLDSATHELRTPLASIRAYAETLAFSEVLDVERQKDFCNTINAEATRLARFIDDLLSISSMEMGSLSLDRRNVDVERLFREVIQMVKPQMDQKNISFHCVFPEKLPAMTADKDKLTVALVNLLGNAAKYTPQGGRVGFKVKLADRRLRVDIEDTGIGISEEDLPRVFEKFFRSANSQVQEQTGSGLGLPMAQEVIRLHGGELTVQSQLGVGTTFTALLPT